MSSSLDGVIQQVWTTLVSDPEVQSLFTNREPFQWGFRESLYRFIKAGAARGEQRQKKEISEQEVEAVHDLAAHAYFLERRQRHFSGREHRSSNTYPLVGLPLLERVIGSMTREPSSGALEGYREYTVRHFLEKSKRLGDMLDDATTTLTSSLNMEVGDSSLAGGRLQHPAAYFIRAHREIMSFVAEEMGLSVYFRALSNNPEKPVEEGNIDANGRFLVPLASYLECVPPEVKSDANILQLWRQEIAEKARIFRQNATIDTHGHCAQPNVSYTAPILTGDLFVFFPFLPDVAGQLQGVVADRDERFMAMLNAYIAYHVYQQQGALGKHFARYVTRVIVPITDPRGHNLAIAEFTDFPDRLDKPIDREYVPLFDGLRQEELLRRRKLRQAVIDHLTDEQMTALLAGYKGDGSSRDVREYAIKNVYGILTAEQISSIVRHQDTIVAARTTVEDRARWQHSSYRTNDGGLVLPDSARKYVAAYFNEAPHADFIDQISVITGMMDRMAAIYCNTKVLRDHLETQRALEAARVELVTAEAEAAKLLIAAGVAHTAKTPLTTIAQNSAALPDHLRVLLDSDQRVRGIGLSDDDYGHFCSYRDRIVDYALSEDVRSLDEARRTASELTGVMAGCHVGTARPSSAKYAKMGFTRQGLSEYLSQFRRYDLNALLDIMYTTFDTFSLAADNIRSSHQLNEIMDSLATYSFRTSSPEQAIKLEDCIHHALVLTKHLKVEHVDLRLDLRGTPPMTCYPGELQEVIVNLLVNSVQALEEKGPLGRDSYISLESYEREGYNCFRITNNGPPIREEDRERIFEPFFTTKPRGRGSGLGLYVCRDIVERRHHGKITVDSNDRETSFEIMLPKDLLNNSEISCRFCSI